MSTVGDGVVSCHRLPTLGRKPLSSSLLSFSLKVFNDNILPMSILEQLCDDALLHCLSFLPLREVYAFGNLNQNLRQLTGRDLRFAQVVQERLESYHLDQLNEPPLWDWQGFSSALRGIGVRIGRPLEISPDCPPREAWWRTEVIRRTFLNLVKLERPIPAKQGLFFYWSNGETGCFHCFRYLEFIFQVGFLVVGPIVWAVLFAISLILGIVILAARLSGWPLVGLLSAGMGVSFLSILLAFVGSLSLFAIHETWQCCWPVRELRERYQMLQYLPSNLVNTPISSVLSASEEANAIHPDHLSARFPRILSKRDGVTLAERLNMKQTRHDWGSNNYEDILISNIVGASLPVYQAVYLTVMVLPSALFVAFFAMLPFQNSRRYALIAAGVLFVIAVGALFANLIVQWCQHSARTLLFYSGFGRRYWQIVIFGLFWWVLFLALAVTGSFVDPGMIASYVVAGFLAAGWVIAVVLCIVSCVFSAIAGSRVGERFEYLPQQKFGRLHIGAYAGRDRRRPFGQPNARDPLTFCGGKEEDGAGQVYLLFGLWCPQHVLCFALLCASLYFFAGSYAWIGFTFVFPVLLVSIAAVCCLFCCMCTRGLYDCSGGIRII